MIIYRFEKNGIGPYINRSNAYRITQKRRKYRRVKKYENLWSEERKKMTDSHLNNYYKVHESRKYMYGCRSKEQLKMYFFGDFKVLFSQGFRIKRYKVPDEEVIDMGTEVAFPVKYHKLQTVNKIKKVRNELSVFG